MAGLAPPDKSLRHKGCMGVCAIAEFGRNDPDVVKLREKSGALLVRALTEAVTLAKQQGDIPPQVDIAESVRFIGTLMQGLQTDARAGVKPEATALRFVSFDGAYTESLTLDQAHRPDVLVAYELEGKPLSTNHGGPARLYVAPMYGYKSCKWLERIELTARVEPGYWEHNGYDVDGWVGKSNGRDDQPT